MARNPLEGRNAIVTGAARGIGRAIAERLTREGARVAILDVDGDAAQTTAGEIGGETIAVGADVADAAQVQSAVGSVLETWGAIDILVNNAGIVGDDAPVAELD